MEREKSPGRVKLVVPVMVRVGVLGPLSQLALRTGVANSVGLETQKPRITGTGDPSTTQPLLPIVNGAAPPRLSTLLSFVEYVKPASHPKFGRWMSVAFTPSSSPSLRNFPTFSS